MYDNRFNRLRIGIFVFAAIDMTGTNNLVQCPRIPVDPTLTPWEFHPDQDSTENFLPYKITGGYVAQRIRN